MAVYLAHRIEETGAEQTMLDHLNGTASLAGAFGAAFGVQEQAHLIGQYHDIGKYSRDFQGYLASGGRRARVDHSTAGMQAFWGQHNIPAAFCVGGTMLACQIWGGLPMERVAIRFMQKRIGKIFRTIRRICWKTHEYPWRIYHGLKKVC